MTWKQLAYRIAVAWQQLEALAGQRADLALRAKPFAIPPALQLEERQCAAEIAAIIRLFTRAGTWPPLSERDLFHLRQRLRYAFYFISTTLTASPFLVIPRSNHAFEPAAIEWLLIPLWDLEGRQEWLAAGVDPIMLGVTVSADESSFPA